MGKLIKTKKIKVVDSEQARIEYWEQQFNEDYKIGEITKENQELLWSLVEGLKRGRMLDNGCGDGRLKYFFEVLGWEVYGTDISKNAILRASKLTPLNLMVASSEDLPFKDHFFDVVFSWRVLHSIGKKGRVLAIKEIDRVLKKGGVFLCSVQSLEDELTLSKYRDSGVNVKGDKGSYVSDMKVGNKAVQRLKHFYAKSEIVAEIENNSCLKVTEVTEYIEKSGWNEDVQKYWVIKAIK